MASYKEIVTKAVLGKGKKTFVDNYSTVPSCTPTTVLGCWVINHQFSGKKVGEDILIEGTYDVNIWYSCLDDTSTEVIKESRSYNEVVRVNLKDSTDLSSEEIIVRSLEQPKCIRTDIQNGAISYTIEKALGVEIVGDTKVKIQYDEEEDPWDDLDYDETVVNDDILEQIDNEVQEDYLN